LLVFFLHIFYILEVFLSVNVECIVNFVMLSCGDNFEYSVWCCCWWLWWC